MVASSYPTGLDSLAKPASSTLENTPGFEHDVVHTKAAEAVEAVQSTLGTNPQGSSATVKARMDLVDTSLAGKASSATIGNLLTANQASVETDLTGLFTTNGTMVRTTAWSSQGSASALVTQTASGNYRLSATIPGASAANAVIRGGTRTVTLSAAVRPVSGTPTGAFLMFGTSLRNYTSTAVAVAIGVTTVLKFTVTLPADEWPLTADTTISVWVGDSTGSGSCYFDALGVWAGAGGDWALPGVPITGTSPTEAQSLTGTGSPNSFVTAPVGSTYTDTAATGGVIRWTKFTGSGNTGWLADPIDSAVVHKSGTETIAGAKTFTSSPTFTSGTAAVNNASGNSYFISNASDTSTERTAGLQFQRRGVIRWIVAKTTTAESGSNAGSDLAVYRYDDAGTLLSTPFSIVRGTGENRIGETTAGTAHLRLDRSAGNVGIITGTGFPEGVVTAPVGSMYTDTAATNGAIRWIKATGSGNTGWRVDFGDTGWRNIVGSAYAGADLAAQFPTLNALQMRRVGMYVTFRFRASTTGGTLVGTASTVTAAVDLPIGWRSVEFAALGSGKGTQAVTLESTFGLNNLRLVTETTPTPSLLWAAGTVTLMANYITDNTWPTILIGTAA